MPWGTSEGGTPQPYQIEIQSAHWELARNRDGELVLTKNGENLMNLVFEGDAHRLVEEEDGSYSVGERIEPLEGKFNRRSFLLGNTSQWTDPREDGTKVENTRGPDQMPWIKSEVGRLIQSLVDLVGMDELETWGPWEEAKTWEGRTFDLVPTHDVKEDGSPVTFKRGDGEERIDWYLQVVAVGGGEGKKAPAKKATRGRRKASGADNGSIEAKVKQAYADFKGSEDEFVDYIQSDEFEGADDLAKLDDDSFDKLVDEVVGKN